MVFGSAKIVLELNPQRGNSCTITDIFFWEEKVIDMRCRFFDHTTANASTCVNHVFTRKICACATRSVRTTRCAVFKKRNSTTPHFQNWKTHLVEPQTWNTDKASTISTQRPSHEMRHCMSMRNASVVRDQPNNCPNPYLVFCSNTPFGELRNVDVRRRHVPNHC